MTEFPICKKVNFRGIYQYEKTICENKPSLEDK